MAHKTPVAPRYSAYDVFLTAEAFNKSGRFLRLQFPGILPSLFEPVIIVNRAFCLELYLKCLLVIEQKTPKWNHKLDDQFGDLTQANQNAIRKEYDAVLAEPDMLAEFKELRNAGKNPEELYDFVSLLADSSDAFQRSRYPFEPSHQLQGYRAVPIEIATRRVIISIYPRWDHAFENLINRSAPPPTSQDH
jgi:hypothetical protein